MAQRPSKGNITYPYGMRIHPITGVRKMHTGEDIGWGNGAGTALFAPAAGVLTSYQRRGDWGMQARIQQGIYEHRLSHMAGLIAGVSVGEQLAEGQHFGTMGQTGLAAGVHVHWEVVKNGQYMDPAEWLREASSAPAAGTKREEDEVITILEIKGNAGAAKSVYDMRTGKAIRLLGKDENTAMRAAQAAGLPVVYISVSAKEYKQRGGK